MKVRTKILTVAACLVIGITWVLYSALQINEPRYQGKSLTEWLLAYEQKVSFLDIENHHIPEIPEAAAVRQIGSAAVPFLLNWIQQEPSFWEKPIGSMVLRFNQSFFTSGREQRAWRALTAFQLLGTNAISAIPALTNIICTASHSDSAVNAALALHEIGKPGTTAILNLLAEKSSPYRSYLISSLRSATNNDAAILPTIAGYLADPDRKVRKVSTNILRQLAPTLLTMTTNHLSSP